MTAHYDRDRGQLACSRAAFDELLEAMRTEVTPASEELRAVGAVHDAVIDRGLGRPLAGVVAAVAHGDIAIASAQAVGRHEFWVSDDLATWWVDTGGDEGQFSCLPAALWAHTVVDVVSYAARMVPGEVAPELPERFTWRCPELRGAERDALVSAVADLAQAHAEREFAAALQSERWLLWHLRDDQRLDLRVLATPFAAYVAGDADTWQKLSGRALWTTLTAWQPWNRRAASDHPFGAREK